MSVLSRPQGTPERVWSLIDGLQVAGGLLPSEDYAALLNPGYARDGIDVAVKKEQAQDATGVSTTLGLVMKDGSAYRFVFDPPITPAQFPDVVHEILIGVEDGEPNAVILDAYAWLVAESHRRNDLGWCANLDRDTFVDTMLVGLTGKDEDGSRPMNKTKLLAWQRWLVFLGLCEDLPATPKTSFWHFSPARRIARELVRAGVPRGQTMSGSEFLRLVAGRCPYLDGGHRYTRACAALGYVHSPRDLSAAMTVGLRELEADGVLEFGLLGDSGDALHFVSDASFRTNSFNRVTVREVAA